MEQQSQESEQTAVGDWDWVGLQRELSQLDLGAEDPKVRAWVSLFLSCAGEENYIYDHDFIINLLRFIKFDSGGCRLEMLGPWLTASAGMHPRVFFTALYSDLDAQYDLALAHTEGMVKLGHALNFPVHFNVVLHWGALFSFASFSVDKALQLADTTMDDKVYDFTKPGERIKILELLCGMKQAIEAEAGVMQIPEVQLFQSQRNLGSLYDFSEAKPSDKRTRAAMHFLKGLTMGKRYPRRDLQSARTRGWLCSDGEDAENESEEAHVVEEDLLSIARQVPSEDAKIMWRNWKESKWGKAAAAAEVSKLASDLTTLLSSDCNEEEVKEFGSNLGTWDHMKETKLGGLQGEALLTFRSLIAGLFCKVGDSEHHHRWDYVLHFLQLIGFSEGGCSLEHTRLGSISFLSASAGAHIRMFVCLGEDLADEFMELLAVMHVRLLKPSTMKMMPFYVINAGYAELKLRAFWVNQEEDRVVGWSTLFSRTDYLLMDPENRGLLAAHLRAISRALVAEQLQLKMQKIVEPTEPRCVTLPQGVEVVTLAQPFDLLNKNCTRPYL